MSLKNALKISFLFLLVGTLLSSCIPQKNIGSARLESRSLAAQDSLRKRFGIFLPEELKPRVGIDTLQKTQEKQLEICFFEPRCLWKKRRGDSTYINTDPLDFGCRVPTLGPVLGALFNNPDFKGLRDEATDRPGEDPRFQIRTVTCDGLLAYYIFSGQAVPTNRTYKGELGYNNVTRDTFAVSMRVSVGDSLLTSTTKVGMDQSLNLFQLGMLQTEAAFQTIQRQLELQLGMHYEIVAVNSQEEIPRDKAVSDAGKPFLYLIRPVLSVYNPNQSALVLHIFNFRYLDQG